LKTKEISENPSSTQVTSQPSNPNPSQIYKQIKKGVRNTLTGLKSLAMDPKFPTLNKEKKPRHQWLYITSGKWF
jgi:hypothetical protein